MNAYPHEARSMTGDIAVCRCGVTRYASPPLLTWGAHCPVALLERIGELERDLAEARQIASGYDSATVPR